MIALELPFVRKKNVQRAFVSKEDSHLLGRIYLALAGAIYLTNGYVYFTTGLIDIGLLLVEVAGGFVMLASVALSFQLDLVKKHLQKILIAALYFTMVQSVFESMHYKYDISHAIMHLIVYMVCCMPFKDSKSLTWFLVLNFFFIAGSTFYVDELAINREVLIMSFFTGGVVS